MKPLTLCKRVRGTFLSKVVPAITPNVEVNIRAVVAPIHTEKGSAVLLKATTANCVLSPNSAIVIKKNVVKRAAGSRYFCESLFWASQPKQAAKT